MFPHAPIRSALIAATASLAFAAGAMAAEALSHRDVKFVQEAAEGGLAEVQLGQLAQQKAVHAEVQDFAKKMVDDHTKANEKLKSIAQENGVQLPDRLNRKHQKLLDELQKLTGGDFDREYMEHMVRDHKKDVKDFRKEAKSKDDSAVKTFAANTLPVLEGHLLDAQKTYDIAEAPKRSGDREVGSKRR